MGESLERQINNILSAQKSHKRWIAIFLCLALIVSLATAAAFKLNGVAKTHSEQVLDCQFVAPSGEGWADYVAHVHNDDCYDADGVLVCPLPEIRAHVHTEDCYTTGMVLTCDQEETEGHVHTEDCYGLVRGDLTCGLEESEGHAHTEECYSLVRGELICEDTSEEHEHSDECYAWDRVLTCELEESEGHIHSDACYAWEEALICGKEAGEGAHIHGDACYETRCYLSCGQQGIHTHDESCYDADGNLICGQLQLVEHVHNEDCFKTVELTAEEVAEKAKREKEQNQENPYGESDSTADVENEAIWTAQFENLELSGDWSRDVVEIAKTQLGYAESQNNFEVVDDVKKGYTRYGAWYGLPYGDWCAMFVSFCLYYADVPETAFPYDCGCTTWIDALTERGMYVPAGEYRPKGGDVIFFDMDRNQLSDHVGLVTDVYDVNGATVVETIEGNNVSYVERFTYPLGSTAILGYGILPENPKMAANNATDPEAALIDNGDNTDNVDLVAESEITGAADTIAYPAQSFAGRVSGMSVTVTADDGAFPAGTIMIVKAVDAEDVMDAVSGAVDKEVVHVQAVDITFFDAAGKEIEPRIPVRVEMRPVGVSDGAVEQVVVHVEDDGKASVVDEPTEAGAQVAFDTDAFSVYAIVYTVDFHYEGMEYNLSGRGSILLSELFRSLGIQEDVAQVAYVLFTDPSLLSVQAVEGDYLLTSLQPFSTDETLSIFMADGREIIIAVSDEQYSGTDVNNLISDATLEIDGRTYGAGTVWEVYPNVDYNLKLRFSERGDKQIPGTSGDTIVVDLPAGLTLENTSGSFDIPTGLAGTIYNNRYEVRDGKLYITFGDDPEDLLTRSSNIYFDIDLIAKFAEGTTDLHFNDDVERDVHVESSGDVTVSKTGSYNAATNQIDYVVTVRSQGTNDSVHVEDQIQGTALHLTAPVTVEPSSKLNGTPNVDTNNNSFSLDLGQMNHNDVVTIRYSADVDISKLGDNFTLSSQDNTNTVSATPDGGDPKTDTFSYTNEIKYSNISKANTGAETDGDTTTLTWTIVVNDPPKASIAGGKITDTIDWNSKEAMKYLTDSNGNLLLDIVVKDANDNVVRTDNNVQVAVDHVSWNEEQQTWSYTIPDDDADKAYSYEITYKTVVDNTKVSSNDPTVRNNSENDHGGSSSGTGIIGPGGGGGGGTDTVTAVKTAKNVTAEYIDWDIVISVPAEGFPGGLRVVDEVPWSYASGDNPDVQMVDTFDSIVGVVGLDPDHNEGVGTPVVTTTNDKYLKKNGVPVEREIVTIDFHYTDENGQQQNGLYGTGYARIVTLTLRTRNDPDWLEAGKTNTEFTRHTNIARVNNTQVQGVGQPMLPTIEKKGSSANNGPNWDSTKQDGDLYFFYDIQLANVTELPLTITDTYDEHMQFVPIPAGVDDQNLIIKYGDKSYSNSYNYQDYTLPTYVANDSTHTLTITIAENGLDTQEDGSFYPYYHVYYYLKVPASEAAALKTAALANGGVYKLHNDAVWGDLSDHVDIDYTVPTIEKDGWFHDSVKAGNERLYDFVIDVNPEALTLNNGQTMTLTDTHSSNLSVDYSSIRVYDLTGTNLTRDQLKQKYVAGDYTPAYDGTDLYWNFDGNIGTFYNVPDNHHIAIVYSALIVGSNTQTFSNEAVMEGYSSIKKDSRSFGSSASAGGIVLQINVLKHELGATSKGLEGAVFQLFVDDGSGDYNNCIPMTYGTNANTISQNIAGKPITFTTDENGLAKIALNQTDHGAQLDENVHYYLKEIDSPPGYQIDSSTEYWSFTLTTDPDEVNYGDPNRRDEHGWKQWIYFYYDDILKMSNTKTDQPVDLTVEKLWQDADGKAITDDDELAALTATVQLYRKTDSGDWKKIKVETNDEGVATSITEVTDDSGVVTLDQGNQWKAEWKDLPRVDQDHQYAYKLEEVQIPEGFSVSVKLQETAADVEKGIEAEKAYTITNRRAENKNTDLTVKKTWLDEGGGQKTTDLPDNVRFTLYQVSSRTPLDREPQAGGLAYTWPDAAAYKAGSDTGVYQLPSAEYESGITFSGLPAVVAEDGQDPIYYYYYVRENEVDGYDSSLSITKTGDNYTFTMVNREKPVESDASLDVVKLWKYNGNDDRSQAEAIDWPGNMQQLQFKLYQVQSNKPIDLSAENVTRLGFSSAYEMLVSMGGSLYDDAQSPWGGPHSAHVDGETGAYWLYRYGEVASTTKFTKLPAVRVDDKGKATYYAYYVKEVPLMAGDLPDGVQLDGEPDVTLVYNETADSYSVQLVNYTLPETTSVTVSKAWTNGGEPMGWPAGVTVEVQLYQNGTEMTGKTLTLSGTEISGTFDRLPKADSYGSEYIYTVKETIKNGDEVIATVNDKPVSGKIEVTGDGYKITNDLQSPGSLVVTKSFDGSQLTEAQKNQITFTVTGPNGFSASKTYAEMTGGSWTVGTELTPGQYVVKETNASFPGLSRTTTYVVNSGTQTSGDTVQVNVAGGQTTTVEFENAYEEFTGDKTGFTLSKSWNTSEKRELNFKLYRVETPYSQSGPAQVPSGTIPITIQVGNNGSASESLPKLATTAYANQGDKITLTFNTVSAFVHGGNHILFENNNPSVNVQAYQGDQWYMGWNANDTHPTTTINGNVVTVTFTVPSGVTIDVSWGIRVCIAADEAYASALDADGNVSFILGDPELPVVYDVSDIAKTQEQVEALGGTLVDYGEIVLNESNNWTTSISELPKYSADGTKAYQYYVVELGGAAYNASYAHSASAITVTNSKPSGTEINVKKVWKNSDGSELPNPPDQIGIEIYYIDLPGGSGGTEQIWSDLAESAYTYEEAWPQNMQPNQSYSLTGNIVFQYNGSYYWIRTGGSYGYSQLNGMQGNFDSENIDILTKLTGPVYDYDELPNQQNFRRGNMMVKDGKYYVYFMNGSYTADHWDGKDSGNWKELPITPGSGSSISFNPEPDDGEAVDQEELDAYIAQVISEWQLPEKQLLLEDTITADDYNKNGEAWAKTYYLSSGRIYYIFEKPDGIEDYQVSYQWEKNGATASTSVIITNTIPAPDTVSVQATKTWADPNAHDHPAVSFTLYRKAVEVNGGDSGSTSADPIPTAAEAREAGYSLVMETYDGFQTVQTIPVDATGEDLTVTWDGLPEGYTEESTTYRYEYLVIENPEVGYELTNVTQDGSHFTFTNTPETITLKVNKVWKINGEVVTAAEFAATEPGGTLPTVQFQLMRITYSDPGRVTQVGDPVPVADALGNTEFELNAENQWSYEFDDLPDEEFFVRKTQYDPDGWLYYGYYVHEITDGSEDFTITYREGENGAVQTVDSAARANMSLDEDSFTITNGKYNLALKVLKTDPLRKPLSGAVFELWKYDETTTHYTQVTHAMIGGLDANDQFTVNADGRAELSNLGEGRYQIREIKPPDGCVITENNVVIFNYREGAVTPELMLDGGDFVESENLFIIPNTPGKELPNSGGMGTDLYTRLGAALILGSALVYGAGTMLGRRRKEGDDPA